MKKTLTTGLALAAALVFVTVSPAQAACALDTQVVFHGLDSFYDNCKDSQNIIGYAYLISAPAATNSNGQDLVCEDGNALTGVGALCPPQAAAIGDGIVAVSYDWGSFNTGSLGCPNPTGAGDGTTPIGIQVVDNDGHSVVVTISFSESLGGFLVEEAHPYDAGTGVISPLSCDTANGPVITGTVTTTSAQVNVPVPTIHSDCDPGTVGEALGLCATSGATRPSTDRGHLYSRQGACGSSPDPRISSGWALTAVQPDPSTGNANVTFTAAPQDSCTFLGATGIIGGTETAAVLGSVQVITSAAATDKVKINNAAFNKSSLVVDFSTENESTIVGFNVYAGSAKLNSGLIAAKGTGSNSYSFEVGRGAVKNNKSVTVEAVTSNGSVIKSAPASLK